MLQIFIVTKKYYKVLKTQKKNLQNKIVNIDINLNEFEYMFVTYYFETKENMFQKKIMIKLKRKAKKNKTALLQSKFENIRKINMGNIKKQNI